MRSLVCASLQGFAVGGEYGGAAIYVAEHADRHRRGAADGLDPGGGDARSVAGAGASSCAAARFSAKTLSRAWAWRIPFLLSAVCSRLALDSSAARRIAAVPPDAAGGRGFARAARGSFLRWPNLRIVLIALFGLLMGQGVVWYTAQFYTQFFLEGVIKVAPASVNVLIMAATAASCCRFTCSLRGSPTTPGANL